MVARKTIKLKVKSSDEMGNTCMNRKNHTLNEIELREILENGTKETIAACNKKHYK